MEQTNPLLRIESPSGRLNSDGRQRLTFGRSADAIVDQNPFMHRVVGALELHGGVWMLINEGASTPLTLLDETGRRVTLPPGARAALTSRNGYVRWRSGHSDYSLAIEIEAALPEPHSTKPVYGPATATLIPPLTGREVDFMVTMARHTLVGSTLPAPTYAEVAHLWSVSKKTVDNTIQNLKAKLASAGIVPPATTEGLVSLLIDAGAISLIHLEQADLDAPSGPHRFAG